MEGGFASLAMERNFNLELDSYESYCRPSSITMMLIRSYQLSLWDGLLDKLFVEFSKGFILSFFILNCFPFFQKGQRTQ